MARFAWRIATVSSSRIEENLRFRKLKGRYRIESVPLHIKTSAGILDPRRGSPCSLWEWVCRRAPVCLRSREIVLWQSSQRTFLCAPASAKEARLAAMGVGRARLALERSLGEIGVDELGSKVGRLPLLRLRLTLYFQRTTPLLTKKVCCFRT
jgi:hypothetical protein